MKFPHPLRIEEVAQLLNIEFAGEKDLLVTGINEIHKAEVGDITFVDHPKYYDKALYGNASVVIINSKVECPAGKALLFSTDPFADFNRLTKKYSEVKVANQLISPTAKIGSGTIIQPNVFIGDNVEIASNCIIHANVSIYHNCIIGNNVIIHSNTVIGGDAFYFKRRPDKYDKLLSCGRVIIHDNVEIGANCTIDRGVTGDTIIGEGTKLDNLIQIGHDTVLGRNCLLAAQVGVAGCVTLEDDVILWGQVGVQKDLTIGKGAVVLGQSGVPKSLEGGKVYFGSPCAESREKMKELAYLRQLPHLVKIITDRL